MDQLIRRGIEVKQVTAMVLAGGRGKRMDIFCQQRPKPILPFAGKYRVIDITLSNCLQSQIGNIAVLVDYQRSAMMEYLNQWKAANGEGATFTVLPPQSASYKGTADAVYQNLDFLDKPEIDVVLVLAGDHIYRMDYQKMLAFHYESLADVTVGIAAVPLYETHRFGTVILGPGGRINEFVEKSSNPASNLASMGIYVFNRKFLAKCLKEDAQNSNSPHDFGYAILPGIVKQDRVFGYVFDGYWQDIGTIESYYKANIQLLQKNPLFTLNEQGPVFTGRPIANTSWGGMPGKVTNSLISPGCTIEGSVENSILSPGVRVEKEARVVNSIVMANTRIGYHSIVDRCILDEGVNIDRYCYLGFGSNPVPQVYDITMVGKDVNLGPQTAVGKKSKIMPGLKLADLNFRFVAPGTVVSLPA
jgi:glucose-1-phosphate adenylyltransferase